MKIHNIRLGLATNSSSTHSLIFLPRAEDNDAEGGEFGWNFFTAASLASRKLYVACQLYNNLTRTTTPEIARLVVQKLVGAGDASQVAQLGTEADSAYVDHQSMYDLPRTWDGKAIDMDFARAFTKFFLQDGLVVLGGNDNTDDEHPLASTGETFSLPIPRDSHEDLIARRDTGRGDTAPFWALFNRKTGAKIRFRFEESPAPVEAASTPELVDIKITGACSFGCSYCYQGSTPEGEVPDYNKISRIADALGELKVFEVALGGGEPTLHPSFVDILASFRRHGVVPNFTTRNLSWLLDPKARGPIIENMGAFAFSVDTTGDVRRLVHALETAGLAPDRASVQYVMGAHDRAQMLEVVRAAHAAGLRTTLLGYKRTGRGADVAPSDYSTWIDDIRSLKIRSIGIDTALAAESTEALKAAGVPPYLFHVAEGAFSMYIDAVTSMVGPSSYAPDKMIKVDLKRLGVADTIRDVFQTFGATAS